jgi:hypothetical protein
VLQDLGEGLATVRYADILQQCPGHLQPLPLLLISG